MPSQLLIPRKFTFYNVGQGLFYSGEILDFNFIYDIGTLNTQKLISTAIDTYIAKLHNNPHSDKDVDYLFISHLDKDHISGLLLLMSKLDAQRLKIKHIVLPYVFGFDNLYLFLKKKVGNVSIVANDTPIMPSSEFRDRRDDDDRDDEKPTILTSEQINEQINKQFHHSSSPFWKFSLEYFENTHVNTGVNSKKTKNTNNFTLPKTNLWTKEELDDIIADIDRAFGKKNRNEGSLTLCHGQYNAASHGIEHATILTGDGNWKELDNIIKYANWLHGLNTNISVFQLPHHGAIKNWNTDVSPFILRMMNRMMNYFSGITFVVTTGHYGKWKHPDNDVLNSVIHLATDLYIVDKNQSYTYR